MARPLAFGVPVELWDEIFDHILFHPYHSTVDISSPFHVVFYLRRINFHHLYEYRALKRHRRRLLLVCKSWYTRISKRSNLWIHRATQGSDNAIFVPILPITTLDCENCSFKAIRLFSRIHGVHIRSLHIYLMDYRYPTRTLVELAAHHLPNLAALSIHIALQRESLTLNDISTRLAQLKALSLSDINAISSTGEIFQMPLLETLELTSNSSDIWRNPSRLDLPALNHIYTRATAFVQSRSFFDCIGHQIQSIGLYGKLSVDHLTFDEVLQQLPNLKLLATDFRLLCITGDVSVAARKLETLVHLGNPYPDFLMHPIIREFLGNVGQPGRKVRISDVWMPSRTLRFPRGGAKKYTSCYSQEERDQMKYWAEEFKKSGVRLEDMKGLTYYEAQNLLSLRQYGMQPPPAIDNNM